MNKILLVAFYCLLSIGSSVLSQSNWIKPDAQWHYDFLYTGGWHYEHMYVEKDTVIKGKSCQVLKTDNYNLNYVTNKLIKYSDPKRKYIYSNADTVFWFHTNEFHILYNFAAKVGES